MGIYGYNMSLNNTNSIIESKEYDLFSEAIIMTESIVYNEFCNHKALLESFAGSEEERKILEEKCDILLEISIKDIKDRIHDLFEKLKRFIREVVSRVKEFFTKEKQRQMEKEVSELKQKINNLEKDNEKLRDDNDELQYEKLKNKSEANHYKTLNDINKSINNANRKGTKAALKTKDEEIESLHSKLAEEVAKTTKMFNNIMKMIDDPLLRFSMYDYVEGNIDPVRYVNSSAFSKIKDYYGNSYRKMNNKDLEEIKLYTSVCNKNALKKIINYYDDNTGKSNNLKGGGYNHAAVHKFVEEELERISKENNPLMNKSINNIIEHLEWVSTAGLRNGSRCAEMISKFEQAISVLEKKIVSNKFEKENITHMDAETKYEIKGNIEYAQFVVGHIKDQIQCLSVFSTYESKKAGLAYSIIKLWNNTIVNK